MENGDKKRLNENYGRDEAVVWWVELFILHMVLLKDVQKNCRGATDSVHFRVSCNDKTLNLECSETVEVLQNAESRQGGQCHWRDAFAFHHYSKQEKGSLSPSESFVKNQIACLVRVVLCERRLVRKNPINVVSSPRPSVLLRFFFCNIFSHNISLLQRRNSLVSDGKYTHNTSPHAHFSQCLASPCQFVTLRSVSSHFTCTTHACGSRYKLFFMITVSCAHPNKTFSIHTSCLSLVFRLCPLSVRLRHHPGHLRHRRWLESDQPPVHSTKRMDSLALWLHDIPPHPFKELCEEPDRMFSKNCVVWTSTWA